MPRNSGAVELTGGRGTFKHAAIYSMAGILGRTIGFIMLPFYSHILRGHGYAVIGMLDLGMAFLITLLTYGVRGSIIRLYHDEKDPARKQVVVSTGVRLIAVVTGALILPLMILSRPIAGFLLDDPAYSRFLIMALVGFFFDLVGQGASAWLLIRSRSILYSAINLMRLFIGLTLNIWLILVLDKGLDGYFISGMVVNTVSGLVLIAIALKQCGTEYDPKVAATIRGFLLPLIPGSLAAFVSRQLERVLVKFQIDLVSVGILEMGYRFPVLISNLISRPLMQSWNTRRFEIADDPGAPVRISRMFTYFLFMVCFAGLFLAVTIKPILILLTPPEFHVAYRITRIEIITIILQGAYYHLSFGLFYAKDTKSIAKIRGFSSAMKIPLTWVFISTWGMLGAAYSAALTNLTMGVVAFRMSQRKYSLPMEWGKLGLILGMGLSLAFLIIRWPLENNALFLVLSGKFMPWVGDTLQGTFLATWKDGKTIRLLMERSLPIAEITLRGLATLPFLALFPVIHEPARARLRRLFARSG